MKYIRTSNFVDSLLATVVGVVLLGAATVILTCVGSITAQAQATCLTAQAIKAQKDTITDAQALKERDCWIRKVKSGEKDLKGAFLAGADLRLANLRGALVHGADFTNADLRGADLEDCGFATAPEWLGKRIGGDRIPKDEMNSMKTEALNYEAIGDSVTLTGAKINSIPVQMPGFPQKTPATKGTSADYWKSRGGVVVN